MLCRVYDYCIAIGKREKIIESKNRFYRYKLTKLVNVDDTIKILTKDKCEKLFISMGNAGYKGNTYQTFVVKLRAFLTFVFQIII